MGCGLEGVYGHFVCVCVFLVYFCFLGGFGDSILSLYVSCVVAEIFITAEIFMN